jgi:hypothetical protein
VSSGQNVSVTKIVEIAADGLLGDFEPGREILDAHPAGRACEGNDTVLPIIEVLHAGSSSPRKLRRAASSHAGAGMNVPVQIPD